MTMSELVKENCLQYELLKRVDDYFTLQYRGFPESTASRHAEALMNDVRAHVIPKTDGGA